MLRRLSCLLSAFAVLFFCAVPAFATGMEMGEAGVGIPVVGNINLDVVDFADYVWSGLRWSNNTVAHFIDKDICPNAPQLYGGHNFIPRRTLKHGQIGLYYVCEYCGKAYGEALEEAYQEYVETLPGKQYNSGGAYLWVPHSTDFISDVPVKFSWGKAFNNLTFPARAVEGIISVKTLSAAGSGYPASVVSYVGDMVFARVSNISVTISINWGTVIAPVTGMYTVYTGLADSSKVAYYQQVGLTAGTSMSLGSGVRSNSKSSSSLSEAEFEWPSFWIAPYVAGSGGNTYELITRVSGVDNSDLYGYVQDGQLYQSTVGTIYNETSNVYQNPVTGDTSNISSWEYDYSDRSYTLTTDEGDEITVTYGDSNVTIHEGGTTYNVYYLMEETEDVQQALESYCDHDYSSVVTTAPTCTASGVRTYTCSKCGASYTQTVPPTGHNYQSAVTMAPTCVNTGVRTFACSECGDSYTVSIAATGHTWETVRSVPTTYDNDTGQLVQQGYTLYECSVCHEQYRIDADSGGSSLPAPSSGGTSTGTDLVEIDSSVGRGFLATIAHGLTEDLPEVLKAASEWFTEFPKFYSSFMTFVKDGVAGCLPDMPRLMMGFGFGMTTFIGIVCKIIGR